MSNEAQQLIVSATKLKKWLKRIRDAESEIEKMALFIKEKGVRSYHHKKQSAPQKKRA